jgi:cell division protease FtsH
MTREELENKMAVLLGGRAAEHLAFGHYSTGAADDLVKVTDIARSMVMRYGMVQELGPVAYEGERAAFLAEVPTLTEKRYSEETASQIDRAIRALVEQAFKRASELLEQKRSILDQGAGSLLQKETLTEQDLRQLLG